MNTSKSKRIGILLFAILIVCSCLFTACKKPGDSTTAGKLAGPEAGVYYYAADPDEYTMTLSENCQFTFSYKNITKVGSYTLEGEVITFDFEKDEDGTVTGKLVKEIITLEYDGVAMRMLKKVNYNVTFNSNGGSKVAEQSVLNGKTAERPADPVRDGYLFVGWYSDEACKVPYNFGSAVSADTVLYAKWVAGSADMTEYTVDFNLGYEGEAPAAVKTLGGQLFNLPTVTRDGYEFKGWWVSMHEDASKLTYKYTDGMELNANTTLFAVWQENGKSMPVVTVDANSIKWDAINGARYHVIVKAPDGEVIKDEPTSGSTFVNLRFADFDAGDYEISVTATVSGQDYTTVRYYRNKALDRVSLFEVVEPSALVFNKVDKAEKYLVTVICGDGAHVHTDIDIGASASYNFVDCEMPEEGIRFIVTAVAKDYASTQSEVFTYRRALDPVGELTLDENTQLLTWNSVNNASGYMVSIVHGDGEALWFDNGAKTSVDLKELAAGSLKISVYAKAKGYVASEIAILTYDKKALATPGDVTLTGSMLSWSAVAGAASYEVKIGDQTVPVTGDTKLDITSWANGGCSISIRAIGTANSAWSEALTVNANTLSELTYSESILTWTPVLDADRYEVQVNDGEIISIVGKNTAEISLTQSGKNILKVRFVNGDGPSEWVTTEVDAYAITFDSRGGDSIIVVYKAVGDKLALPMPDRQGYEFVAWYNTPTGPLSNGAIYNDGVFVTGSEMMLYAYYTAKSYRVDYNMSGGGSSNQTGATVTYNEHFKLDVPTANSGTAAFGGWYSAPNGMGTKLTDSNGNSLAPWDGQEDTEIYAHWAEKVLQYTLTRMNGIEVYSVIQGIGAAAVSEITIPATYKGLPVAMVAGNAFRGCSNLVTLNIPNTVQTISTLDVFTGCTSLENVNIYDAGATNPRYASADGVVFERKVSASGAEELRFLFMPVAKSGTYRIPDNVVSIPPQAFASSKLNKVIIPVTVTSIGTEAFYNCQVLTSVVFETSANAPALSIGDRAFKDCKSLTRIVLPARLSSMSMNRFALSKPSGSPAMSTPERGFATDAFFDCRYTTEILVTSGGKTYKSVDGAIYSADGNTLLYVPVTFNGEFEVLPGTKTIADGAFFQTGVTKVTIPNTVTTIGTCAFYGCEQLVSVTFADKGFNALSIGKYAFRGCTRLATVTTTPTLATIGEGAFINCSSLTEIVIGKDVSVVGAQAFLGCSKLKTVTVNSTKELRFGSDAFYGCESINTISLPATVMEIPGIFAGCSTLTNVIIAEDNQYLVSENGVVYNKDKTELLFYPIAKSGDFVIPETVTKIANGVFAGNINLSKVTLSSKLTEIGDGAFRDCSKLTRIDFSKCTADSLTIGEYAFYGTAIDRVSIPRNVRQIGKYAFAATKSLTRVSLNKNMTVINEGVFAWTTKLSSIEIPAQITEIGDYAFKGSAVTEVKFAANSSLKVIGEGAFMYDDTVEMGGEFTKITIPKSVEIIKAYAFGPSAYSGTSLQTVFFEPDSCLKTIGAHAFENSALTAITIPKSVTSIEAYAFANLSRLTSVMFEPGGTEPLVIGTQSTAVHDMYGALVAKEEEGYAFYSNTKLTKVTLPERLIEITQYSFARCGGEGYDSNWKPVTIKVEFSFGENPQLTTIGDYAFQYSGLKDITIPKSVKNQNPVNGVDRMGVGTGAFYGAAVDVITFEGGGTDPLTLGENAFVTCNKTKVINLPARLAPYSSANGQTIPAISVSLFTIGDYDRCPALTAVNVEEGGRYVGSKNGVLYANDFTELVLVPEKYAGGTVLTVPKTVVKIGDMAVFKVTSIEKVEFEEGSMLQSIGAEAFYEATALKEIALPSGTASLGSSVFYGCEALEKITLSKNIEEFTGDMVEGCINLKDISVEAGSSFMKTENGVVFSTDGTQLLSYPMAAEATTYIVPDTVQVIGANAFYGNMYLENIILPEGLIKIEDRAFRSAKALKSVVIPKTVQVIDAYAFDNVKSLESIVFEEGGTVGLGIGDNAFSYSGLKAITLPERTIAIGSRSFAYAYYLEELVFEDGMQLEIIGDSAFALASITSLNLPSVKELGNGVFDSCDRLVVAVIQEGLVRMGNEVFLGCASLESVSFPASLEKMGSNIFGDENNTAPKLSVITFAEGSRLTEIPVGTFTNTGLVSFEIPAGVTSMGSPVINKWGSYDEAGVFQGCDKLTTVTFALGSKLSNIGNAAFSGCSSLESITIPASVVSIGSDAFNGCKALTSITVPETVAAIGDAAFSNCQALATVNYHTVAPVIPKELFYGCKSMTVFVVPQNVTQISDFAFYGAGILEIEIPSAVTSIGRYAFAHSGLTQIVIPANVAEIGAAAFNSCENLATVVMNAKLDVLGHEAANITANDGIFANCSSLASVTLPENMQKILDYSFHGCAALKTLELPAGLTSLGYAFGESGLESYTLAEGNTTFAVVDGILYNADKTEIISCPPKINATSITIPKEVVSIASGAFRDVANLQQVIFEDGDISLTIGSLAFYACKNLVEVQLPDRVTSLGEAAFSESGLRSIVIPGSIDTVEAQAFYKCLSLSEVILPEGLMNIKESAFERCTSLYSITLPSTLVNIGDRAFMSCSKLVEVCNKSALAITAGNNSHGYVAEHALRIYSEGESLVEKLGDYIVIEMDGERILFAYAGTSMDIVVPDGITVIREGVFEKKEITSLHLPEGLKVIGESAFACDNELLTELVLPSTLTTIGYLAFEDQKGLTTVVIPASVTEIDDDPFYGTSVQLFLVEAAAKGKNWSDNWNNISYYDKAPVLYGYTGVEITYTFEVNGGSAIEPITSTIAITLPKTTKEGYLLGGWYDNAELTGSAVSGSYYNSGKTTLYARWLTQEELETLYAGTAPGYAIELTLGSTATGIVDSNGEKVWFKFTVSESGVYTITCDSGGSDTKGTIYDDYNKAVSNGSYFRYNDDYRSGHPDFGFNVELTAGVTYYLAAQYYYSSTHGEFIITFEQL